ncbi:hypothetical protein CN213_15985 [Sinorhizobium meliloti]|uniref:hypothetical protein n=1 Tax=Rhizobium meliloti TaxID=382 RepID=UPI000FDB0A16|nr:hypothetical protein [Sinorhizobium meliloti]RVH56246.1 hypothetical protein CN213_15985 [Sinorhizobium meliloti]
MKAPRITKSVFENEAALCSTFIAALPEGWTAYPETAGFDILLVRADGAQIGVEAKMTLNAKVLLQAVEGIYGGGGEHSTGPDFRAVLVPFGTAGVEMKCVARYVGATVIECRAADEGDKEIERQVARYGEFYRRYATRDYKPFTPELPKADDYFDWREAWIDFCPLQRCPVPDYVPDVAAGASGPSQLSAWKIKAIKICIILEKRGWVAVADFKHIGIDRKRWLDMWWLQPREGMRGHYVAGRSPLDLRRQHPVNYAQIEADFEKWKPADAEPVAQVALI